MRRVLAVLLASLQYSAFAQIDDRGYTTSDQLDGFSFDEEQLLTADADIPPLPDRDEGPSIEISEFQFDNIPEFPELGLSRQSVEAFAEGLRREYSQKPNQLASGYTEQELLELAALLPTAEQDARQFDLPDLEQIANYILSVSGEGAIAGLRQYEIQGLVELMQRLATSNEAESGQFMPVINSLEFDALVRLVNRQRVDRGINFYELDDIAAKISGLYRSKGVFLARAYIPAQTVSNGVVRLDILAGTLSAVTVSGNKRYSEKQLVKPFQSLVGSAAKNDDIEEALYLINDLPGLLVQGALSAGDRVGETALNLSVAEEKRWRATITADNHGAVFTGDNRVLTMFDVYNPLAIGDTLTLGYLSSWSPVNSEVGVFQYRVPVLDERTHAYVSIDVNQFTVDGDGDQTINDLNIEGENTNYTLGIDRQFKRLPSFALSAGFSLTEKETEIEADIDLPGAGEKVQGAQLNASFNNISRRFQLMNMAVASVQYGRFESGVDENLGQENEFYKFALDWSTLKLVDLPFTDYQSYILARTKWRYSDALLPAFEQLPLGGSDAVRAYTVSDFSADQAVYIGAEWYVEFPASWISDVIKDKFKVALFADGAYGVTNQKVSGVSNGWANLAGAGLLFKFTWQDTLGTTISFSKPVSSKTSSDGGIDDIGADGDSIQTYIEVTFVYD